MFETTCISEILTYQHEIEVFVLSPHLTLFFHLHAVFVGQFSCISKKEILWDISVL